MTDQTVDPGDSTPDNQSRPQRDTAPSGAAESVPQATSETAAAGESSRSSSDGGANTAASSDGTPSGDGVNRPRRRRGSRGGRNRNRSGGGQGGGANASGDESDDTGTPDLDRQPDELPKRASQNRPRDTAAADEALVKKPQIGDSRPDPAADSAEAEPGDGDAAKPEGQGGGQARSGNRRRRGGRGRGGGGGGQQQGQNAQQGSAGQQGQSGQQKGQQQKKAGVPRPVEAILGGDGPELDDETLEKRKGRERNGRPVGRYMMAVSVRPEATQIAVLEGRNLIEHYVSRPADDVAQIHGNIYLGKVQNVLPGMEAAFVDIATPKNAVLYRGDLQFDAEDVEGGASNARIEQILKPRQTIICQVTKNPIAHKGARLTQEVSLPGRFVVLIPNSSTYGISKRLDDSERKRLRNILDKVKPPQHGVIVRTAAEGVTSEEISSDVRRLLSQWDQIEALANSAQAPALLYREPDMAVRVIREEFNDNYRSVVIDDEALFNDVHGYVSSISPALADRIELYDRDVEPLSIFERHHVHEQVHKALDRKVWLPSGGSLIIEHTEALTVIDVNTGKNVGSKSLEETVYRNNLEAAVEIAKQLRLRDIGGIIVIDFIDMEIKGNRDDVVRVFRDALARDKTRTQVFDISELGLVEMTRKRIGEGLLESFAGQCPDCEGRGVRVDPDLLV
ncbi:CafA Ribonucleases G and E [Acidimicrobiia bacterium]